MKKFFFFQNLRNKIILRKFLLLLVEMFDKVSILTLFITISIFLQSSLLSFNLFISLFLHHQRVTIKYEHVCWKQSKQNPSEPFLLSIRLRSFFSPFAHSFDYAAKGQVWRKTWAAIDRLKRGCETRLSFFLFLLARKNHRIIKIKKTISPRTDHFITSQLILSQRMAWLEVKR